MSSRWDGKRETFCVNCLRPTGLGYRDRLCRNCRRGGNRDEAQPSIRDLINERKGRSQ